MFPSRDDGRNCLDFMTREVKVHAGDVINLTLGSRKVALAR